MLLSLKVKNYALISDVELSFDTGMNIITGETGAGKSILIGAMGMALGNRADTSALRNKEAKCVIEAVFDIENYKLQSFFKENDLDYETHSILRREITTSGKSRAFINDTPVNLKELSLLGGQLIEIHSQHDNLQLFKKEFQFYSLDALSNNLSSQLEFSELFEAYKQKQKALNELKEKEAELAKEADFNQFLFDELAAAELETSNEKALNDEQELLENAEELIRTFSEADQLFSGSEYAVIEQLQNLKRVLSSQKTSITNALVERLNAVIIELQDIASEVSTSADNVEVNPERLELINEKLGVLFNLKTKHRVQGIDELIEFRNSLEDKLGESHSLGNEIVKLEKELNATYQLLQNKASNLSQTRKSNVAKVELQLNGQLEQLGMQHSRIKFHLEKEEILSSFGFDKLEIQLSSDKGKTFSDLKKSASGGELARINLSVKSMLADFVQMPSSIFDEIDTGVSGEIASKVGGMMKEMSTNQQVIVITHLPQIASLGSNHLFVYKSEHANDIETKVRTLTGDERINEIAKMISGDNLTEHAVEQSKTLLRG